MFLGARNTQILILAFIRYLSEFGRVPPPIPLVLTLIALGLLRQCIKHTRFLMDENVAFLQYFRNSFLRLNTRPEEFRKASGFLRIMPQHPGLQYISREYDSRLLLYLDEGGELSPPGAQN